MKIWQKILSAFLAIILFSGSAFVAVKLLKRREEEQKITIVASNFAGYDFARAVIGNDSSVSLLLKPGTDAHSYEPTPADILTLAKADLFIYNGGESESWVAKMVESSEIDKSKTLRMMDVVELKMEDFPEGGILEAAEEDTGDSRGDADDKNDGGDLDLDGLSAAEDVEVEYDEHIWTSPANAILLVDAVREKLATIYPSRAEEFKANADQYIERLKGIDASLRELVAKAKRQKLIVADRFPFRYFTEEYGLDYLAAFPGCSEQTEASSATVAALIQEVRNSGAGVILKIELTSDELAQTVAAETGAKILVLNATHNVSAESFRRGATYADFWDANLDTLEQVLN